MSVVSQGSVMSQDWVLEDCPRPLGWLENKAREQIIATLVFGLSLGLKDHRPCLVLVHAVLKPIPVVTCSRFGGPLVMTL